MAQSDRLDARSWPALHDRLDSAIAEAASRYLDGLVTRPFAVEADRWSKVLD